MSNWISAGAGPRAGLPEGQLTDEELVELRRLLGLRQELLEKAAVMEQRLELFVLAARDRRGLAGRVKLNASDGRIISAPENTSENEGASDGNQR